MEVILGTQNRCLQNAYNGTYAQGTQAWWDSFDQDGKVCGMNEGLVLFEMTIHS